MSNEIAKLKPKENKQPKSVLMTMAGRFGMEPKAFESTVKQTVMPNKGRNVSNEEFASFLLVAKEYDLNPLVKEIYAFPSKAGGIQPIVSIDGWVNMINKHEQLDGIEFKDIQNNGQLEAIECRIFRKDRSHPIIALEYMSECKRNTEPWNKWPRRMLRHKALIQCARYAFGFSGIVDPDEGERFKDVTPVTNPELKEAFMNKESEAKVVEQKDVLDELFENAPKEAEIVEINNEHEESTLESPLMEEEREELIEPPVAEVEESSLFAGGSPEEETDSAPKYLEPEDLDKETVTAATKRAKAALKEAERFSSPVNIEILSRNAGVDNLINKLSKGGQGAIATKLKKRFKDKEDES